MARKRIGMRRWNAVFWRHDGTLDDYGQPTYDIDNDWAVTGGTWPLELVSTVGGEVLRGRQVNEKTTHVAFGEFFGTSGIVVTDRCVINGNRYGITNMSDSDGLQTERRVELRGENE